jgi:hypothetical protein
MYSLRIPPHIFNSLYLHYKTGTPTNQFLQSVFSNNAFHAADRAEPAERMYLADIILFNHYACNFGYLRQVGDEAKFNLRWQAWRIRFSPMADEIDFNPGDDDD